MLIKLLVFATVVAGVILWVSPQARERLRPHLPRLLLVGGVGVLLLLVVTGRLSWIGAAIAALIPLARRALPLVLNVGGLASRLFAWRTSTAGAGNADDAGASTRGAMTRADALAILGLEEGADRTAILAAHRRLMHRCHPDRGGSDYLAARLNEARDCLLQG